jgi:hypothetical protein
VSVSHIHRRYANKRSQRMSEQPSSLGSMWKKVAYALGAGVTVLAAASHVKAERDDRGCRLFDGRSSAVAAKPCASPVGLCTHGQLGGDFVGQYDFVATTLQSANDPSDPTEFVFTGHSVITASDGTMSSNDNGVIHISPGATTAPFATTILIVGGTGRFAGATGTFVDRGISDLITGGNSGAYIAQICRSER